MTYEPFPPYSDHFKLEKALYESDGWYLLHRRDNLRHHFTPGNSMIVHKCPGKDPYIGTGDMTSYSGRWCTFSNQRAWCNHCLGAPNDDLITLWLLHNADHLPEFIHEA